MDQQHVPAVQVLATGGMSFPRMGTDGTGHRIVEGLGHDMRSPYPALVPLRSPHPAGQQLAGQHLQKRDALSQACSYLMEFEIDGFLHDL